MPTLHELGPTYQTRLDDLIATYGIPGAGVAIVNNGELLELSAGITNLNTNVEVDADTLFLIGSITKTLTTTVLMQLVDEGNIDLDQPVKRYLPDLQLGTPEATDQATVRQLVTHSSGIPGDYVKDFGRGDDALTRYVASFGEIGQLHEPDSMISYTNSAFGLVGRIIEQLTGQTWDEALRTRLLAPLGMNHFATLPEDALRYRVGIGHRPKSLTDPTLEVGPMWPEVRSGGPAGFTPWAAPRDLITYAQMHMNDGKSTSGEQIVSAESVAAMQHLQKEPFLSGSWDGVGICLSFFRLNYTDQNGDSVAVFGHNGGRSATLRFIPSRQFAISVLTNAAGGTTLATEFIDDVVGDLFNLTIPKAPAADPTVVIDPRRYVGTYQHVGFRVQVKESADGLSLIFAMGPVREDDPGTPLRAVTETIFINGPDGDLAKVGFVEPDADGRFQYVHVALRAFKRVD